MAKLSWFRGRKLEFMNLSTLDHCLLKNTTGEIQNEMKKIDQDIKQADELNSVGSSESTEIASRPATDNNMVQSVKFLRDHKRKMIGQSQGKMLDTEESAIYGNVNSLQEGVYTDTVVCSDADKMAIEIEEQV